MRAGAVVGLLVTIAATAPGCSGGDPAPSDPAPMTRLTVDRTYLRDDYGRYVFFHGANVSGDTKVADIKLVGGQDVPDFQKKATFVQITNAGLRESHAHDVMITKEAPNYRMD